MQKKRDGFSSVFTLGCLAFVIITLFFSSMWVDAVSTPDKGDCSCHTSDGYSIYSDVDGVLRVQPRTYFSFSVYAEGEKAKVIFHYESYDNSKFAIIPSNMIKDNGIFDLDKTDGLIEVNFTLYAPAEKGYYKLQIFVQSEETDDGMPSLACITIDVIVGSITVMDVVDIVFNHMNMYLGLLSIIFLGISTILYERSKFSTRSHGIMSTISLTLTVINVILILETLFSYLQDFRVDVIYYWYMIFHIALGGTGLIFGFIALYKGLAGIRTKVPGYLALILWSAAFVTGIIFWGFNLV